MRVGILVSHPIQYQSPWFRALAEQIDLEVFYAHRPTAKQQGAGFAREFNWDTDLLSGYHHSFLLNRSHDPGTHHFFGCDTPQIAGTIRESSFDVFVVFGWFLKSYWQAIRACRRRQIPVLVRGDSILNSPRLQLHAVVKEVVYRIGQRQFDGFLSVGKRNAEYLKHYGVRSDSIFFVPHFVDNERFASQAKSIRDQKSEIRSQWKIPEHAFCVLFCGKFIPKKRPLDLIGAAQQLITENQLTNLHLLFVGSGELGAELRSHCDVAFDQENPSLTSDIRSLASETKPPASFAGFLNQTEISKAYVAADVLVLPSDGRETWGLVVNEAMACGTPAIVSDAVGCSPDLIDEGNTGFTFPLGDIDTLARQVACARDLTKSGFEFSSHLQGKLTCYSLEVAVEGALGAFATVSKTAGTVCAS